MLRKPVSSCFYCANMINKHHLNFIAQINHRISCQFVYNRLYRFESLNWLGLNHIHPSVLISTHKSPTLTENKSQRNWMNYDYQSNSIQAASDRWIQLLESCDHSINYSQQIEIECLNGSIKNLLNSVEENPNEEIGRIRMFLSEVWPIFLIVNYSTAPYFTYAARNSYANFKQYEQ